MRKITFLLLPILLSTMQANAYDFELNGIYYNFIEEKPNEVEVVHFIEYWHDDFDGEGNYEGDIIIPETVIYEDKEYQVTSIGEIAFEEGSIESVVIPKSIKYIGWGAFRNLRATLKRIEVQWQTPLELEKVEIASRFDTSFEHIVLVVPANTKALYEGHEVWQNFTHIEEKGAEPAQANDVSLNPREIHMLNGAVVLEMRKGINFPCIALHFSDENINMGFGTYIEVKERGGLYIVDGKPYTAINYGIKECLKNHLERFYNDYDKKEYGKEVWSAFVEEGGLQLFLDIANGYIDDEFLSSPFNEIYG